jgi:hypothetical protein
MAILNNDARKATVTAHGDLKCAKMDRARFERLLGPLATIMRRMLSLLCIYSFLNCIAHRQHGGLPGSQD